MRDPIVVLARYRYWRAKTPNLSRWDVLRWALYEARVDWQLNQWRLMRGPREDQ